jgi:esterase/lipase superfamily enzyme
VAERGDKIVSRWYSPRLHREVNIARYGVIGQPVLLFPTAGGDFEESERFLMMNALGALLDAGRIKVYSVDSVAGKALVSREGSPRHQMWLQNEFHHFIRHELVPAIRMDCKSDLELWASGASIGAFHAAAVMCRFPDVFSRSLCMSGTYDLRRFYDCGPHDFSDDFWVSSPLHFVPRLEGRHLDVLKTRYCHIVSGEGRAEDIGESWNLARVLGGKGIPNKVESWGPDWHHDWVTWRKMLPQILDQWTRPQGG